MARDAAERRGPLDAIDGTVREHGGTRARGAR